MRNEPVCKCGHAQHDHAAISGTCIIAGCDCKAFARIVAKLLGLTSEREVSSILRARVAERHALEPGLLEQYLAAGDGEVWG